MKTPIATVIAATDNLSDENEKLSEENRKEIVNEISIAAERLSEQVENLLSMSRLDSGYLRIKADWCDVNELIYSVVNSFEDKLKTHKLRLEISDDLPLFKLDFVLMQQVLHNLLANAIQYTPVQSEITISAASMSETEGHFTSGRKNVRTHRDSVHHTLILDIKDNGPGFPPDELEDVFTKFYRLKNSEPGGTGLGLSIAKGFVEAHHGTIELSNIETGGARFFIQIPAPSSFVKETGQ